MRGYHSHFVGLALEGINRAQVCARMRLTAAGKVSGSRVMSGRDVFHSGMSSRMQPGKYRSRMSGLGSRVDQEGDM